MLPYLLTVWSVLYSYQLLYISKSVYVGNRRSTSLSEVSTLPSAHRTQISLAKVVFPIPRWPSMRILLEMLPDWELNICEMSVNFCELSFSDISEIYPFVCNRIVLVDSAPVSDTSVPMLCSFCNRVVDYYYNVCLYACM